MDSTKGCNVANETFGSLVSDSAQGSFYSVSCRILVRSVWSVLLGCEEALKMRYSPMSRWFLHRADFPNKPVHAWAYMFREQQNMRVKCTSVYTMSMSETTMQIYAVQNL